MATIINNPSDGTAAGSGMGVIVGVIVALVVLALFFIYALPALRGNTGEQDGSATINVDLPNPGTTEDSNPQPQQ